ncbi:MAG TPA: hypothetical protein VGO47_02870, partial [Chlamydiales bacterium]|nr:hypothetical protein [Chlamydiales bacterium]
MSSLYLRLFSFRQRVFPDSSPLDGLSEELGLEGSLPSNSNPLPFFMFPLGLLLFFRASLSDSEDSDPVSLEGLAELDLGALPVLLLLFLEKYPPDGIWDETLLLFPDFLWVCFLLLCFSVLRSSFAMPGSVSDGVFSLSGLSPSIRDFPFPSGTSRSVPVSDDWFGSTS